MSYRSQRRNVCDQRIWSYETLHLRNGHGPLMQNEMCEMAQVFVDVITLDGVSVKVAPDDQVIITFSREFRAVALVLIASRE
jgi:hypothetical protein